MDCRIRHLRECYTCVRSGGGSEGNAYNALRGLRFLGTKRSITPRWRGATTLPTHPWTSIRTVLVAPALTASSRILRTVAAICPAGWGGRLKEMKVQITRGTIVRSQTHACVLKRDRRKRSACQDMPKAHRRVRHEIPHVCCLAGYGSRARASFRGLRSSGQKTQSRLWFFTGGRSFGEICGAAAHITRGSLVQPVTYTMCLNSHGFVNCATLGVYLAREGTAWLHLPGVPGRDPTRFLVRWYVRDRASIGHRMFRAGLHDRRAVVCVWVLMRLPPRAQGFPHPMGPWPRTRVGGVRAPRLDGC